MKARSVRTVRPPSKSRFSSPTEPLASALISSCGSSPLAPASKGPERLTSTSPPSSPSAVTCIERSSSPLFTPSRPASSRTVCGSSPLLLLVPLSSLPPQAAKTLAIATQAASRARSRKRVKGWSSSRSRTGPSEDSRGHWLLPPGRRRGLLPYASHPLLDFLDDHPHRLDPGEALRLRRDYPPAGARAIGPLQHLLHSLLVLRPFLAVAPVLVGQLPRLQRVLGTGFEALQLL